MSYAPASASSAVLGLYRNRLNRGGGRKQGLLCCAVMSLTTTTSGLTRCLSRFSNDERQIIPPSLLHVTGEILAESTLDLQPGRRVTATILGEDTPYQVRYYAFNQTRWIKVLMLFPVGRAGLCRILHAQTVFEVCQMLWGSAGNAFSLDSTSYSLGSHSSEF